MVSQIKDEPLACLRQKRSRRRRRKNTLPLSLRVAMRLAASKAPTSLLPPLPWLLVSLLALGAGTGTARAAGPETREQGRTEAAGSQVGQLLRQVVEERLRECHLVVFGEAGLPGSIIATLLRSPLDFDVLMNISLEYHNASFHSLALALVSPGTSGAGTGTARAAGPETREQDRTEAAGSQVGQLLRQVVEERLRECHLVVFGEAGLPGSIIATLLRSLGESGYTSRTVVDITSLDEASEFYDPLTEDLRGLGMLNCRAFLIDVSPLQSQALLRFMEDIELYKKSETYVLLVGPEDRAGDFLSHPVFRNTANMLYFGHPIRPAAKGVPGLTSAQGQFSTSTKRRSISPQFSRSQFVHDNETGREQRIVTYTRCFYCNDGEEKQFILDTWTPHAGFANSANLFPDQFKTFYGHKFNVVAMNWFPFTKFIQHSEEGGTVVTPQDSLDIRMLNALAKALNFTYEMRTPWDNQWGTSTPSGNWTGIVGTLQHHKGDFSMMLSWMEPRLPIVDYSRIYASEPLVMVTSKPKPLSQAFALVRPFAASLWFVTVASTLAAGMLLWLLQLWWSGMSGGEKIKFGDATLMTWGILLEDPPVNIPRNVTAQMLIGWWWVYCMLITITYRSSLVAHLTVPGKSPTLDSLEDLLAAHRKTSWTWGFEPTYGSGWEWLKSNENPTVKEIFNSIMVLDLNEQLSRVLSGRHAFITWKYYSKSVIGSRYTNDRGYSPLHTGRQDFFNYGGYGWGFRKGAPFRRRFDQMKQRLIESGSIPFWLNDLIETSARQTRAENKRKEGEQGKGDAMGEQATQESSSLKVLGLGHMQGIFYILIIGLLFSATVFLGELMAHRYCRPAYL
ncbi:ionotropic receptor 21a-like [Penaeus japonicus]|uniref:ionotropic receptor 21a-like n=1 Tax=Penaeus japonicus TaxID=27405 RepID=UPI001C714F8B|nr:ionotropic receptor 21a-like [Penaeus japonicus]